MPSKSGNIKNIEYLFLLIIVFISGFCALVYEVLWGRMLMLVFGTSVPAVSTVLAAYMSGMALGSYLFGRLADRSGIRVIRLYSFIGAGTAITAFLVPISIRFITAAYMSIGGFFGPNAYVFTIIRFILAFSVLLPTATMIGGVLPVASRIVIRRLDGMGKRCGQVYSINTLGSVLGAFICGFFLMRKIGISSVNGTASLINLTVGAALLIYSIISRESHVKNEDYEDSLGIKGNNGYLYLMYGLSGFAALGYEVVWTRALVFVLGNRVYAFTTILSTFLAGIAFGSFVASLFADRIKRLYLIFGINELMIAVFGICTIPIINHIEAVQGFLYSALHPGWTNYLLIKFIKAFLPLFLPTFLMGTTFPLVIRMGKFCYGGLGAWIGKINAANTSGAILGSVASGFLFVPLLGMSGTLTLLTILNLFIGIAAILMEKQKRGSRFFNLACITAMISFAVVFFVPKEIGLGKKGRAGNLIYFKEGLSATVAVFQNPINKIKRLEINGVIEVPTDDISMRTFKVLGHLPLLLHENPEDVLMITFGGGIAAGSAACHPIKRIDCVEICEGVLDAARTRLNRENNNVLKSPLIKVFIEDGRNYLLMNSRKYDVIISDATHPTGVDSWVLYTREFYELCRARLCDNGIIAQWIPLHDITEYEYKSILKTFSSVFPQSSLWLVGYARGGGHTILLGSIDSCRYEIDAMTRKMECDAVKKDLSEYGFYSPEDLLRLRILTGKGIDSYTAGSPVNNDDYSFLAFPRSPFVREPVKKKVIGMLKYADTSGCEKAMSVDQ